MTDSQFRHLNSIIAQHNRMMTQKFTQGAEEHGGDLRDKPLMGLLDEAISENIDQFTYLITLREKFTKLSVPLTHTPGREIKTGQQDIECYLCWNSFGEHRCRQSTATAT